MQARKQQNWIWNNRRFQIGKGVHKGCILSPCLFNLHAVVDVTGDGMKSDAVKRNIAHEPGMLGP